MTHGRLHALTDGIFAIVMTLMVLELKLPDINNLTNQGLWSAMLAQKEVFASYFVSFAVLFVYWRAHNFIITFLAKNIDINLISINMIFLFFVGLVPFTTHLAGAYNKIPLALCFYSLNIVVIGCTLLAMRFYIEKSDSIDNVSRTAEQRRAALIRTSLPVVFAALAMPASFISITIADFILLFGVAYNFFNNAADLADKVVVQPVSRIFKNNL
jgi:uncharacterized membrane protein